MTGPSVNTVVLAGIVVGGLLASGEKSQGVRLVDVLALGPYMILLGTRRQIGEREGQFLQFAGGATIGYNARNWLHNRPPGALSSMA